MMIKKINKMFLFGTLISSAVIFSSCSSMEVVKGNELNGMKLQNNGEIDVAHISVAGYGLYFLKFPLITGNFEKMGSVTFFSDDISVKEATKAITRKARKMGADSVINLTSTHAPGEGLIWFKRVQASANAVK
ncbi:DUF1471 domain-containing protein [Lentisphaerota bacterium WC36G]|nr:hypothetical protein LJT99_06650 [Lentisphaerae bacterium WC36]